MALATSGLLTAFSEVALADGGAGGGTNGGIGGVGYTGAAGTAGTAHGGGGGGAAGGGAGGAGAPASPGGAGGAGGNGGLNNQNGGTAGDGGDGSNGAQGSMAGGGSGGGGGAGGAGFYFTGSVSDLLTTSGSATIRGGKGGKGGKGFPGGGAGGKGGGGGGGVVMASGRSVTVNVTSITGGNGGNGGDGANQYDPATAGYGGVGGAGVTTSNGASVTINLGTITGGNGGAGGTGGATGNPGNGGAGGAGGAGVEVTGGGFVSLNHGTVTGGNGAAGGNGGSNAASVGGNGGAGGIGLSLTGGGTITVGTGTNVNGGNGGTSGTGSTGSPTTGAGGAGIKASGGASVTIAGNVTGGMNGTNAVRAHAIDLTGGGNTLTLQNGYAFTGNVVSDGTGAGDTLALGGTVNGTFALGDLDTVFQGFRAFQKSGTSTWTVTGTSANSFSSPTMVTAGTLALQSAHLVNSPVTVSSDGTLSFSGSSSVSSLDVYGVVAMADATALLSSGNVTFRSGSTYSVQVDSSSWNQIAMSGGSVQLSGGTVKVVGIPSYGPNYTVASGTTLAGTFASAEMANGTAFILPTLHYDVSGQVYLTFARASFASVARTANQLQIATTIDAQGVGGPIATALLSMTADEARAAYDALSGSSYASTETAVVEQSFTSQNLMIDRLLSHASNHLWGKVFGTLQSGGSGNATPYSSRTSGVMGGADSVFGDWRLGAMVGYGRGAFATSTTAADSAQYYAGIYASTNLGDLQLRTGAGYARAQVAATRKVVIGPLSDTLSSTYGVNLEQAFAEIGYKLNLGGTRIEPFGGLAKVMSQTPAVIETGGSTALNVGAASDDITLATLGLHGMADFTLGTTAATLQTTLAWQHAFGSAPQTAMTFQSGGTFNAAGAPVATDSAIVRADLGLTIAPNAVLSLSYAGEFAAGSISQTANAEFNVQF